MIIMIFYIDVKNNIGVPTKFSGTQDEFNKAYAKYFKSDTYGKIIGVTSEANNVREDYERERREIQERSNKLNEDLRANKKSINKRYHRYL